MSRLITNVPGAFNTPQVVTEIYGQSLAITADGTALAPTVDNVTTILVTLSANTTINGFIGGSTGQIVTLVAVSGAFDLTAAHGSTVVGGVGFTNPNAASIVLQIGYRQTGVQYIYTGTAWVAMNYLVDV